VADQSVSMALRAGSHAKKALPGGPGPLSRKDLVAAFVSDLGHEDYIKFSRVWRQVRRRFYSGGGGGGCR